MHGFDGETTTLEHEVGALPVAQWYEVHARVPRALNYGTSAAWVLARKVAFGGFQARGGVNPVEQMGESVDDNGWSVAAADAEQADRLVELTRQGLREGAIDRKSVVSGKGGSVRVDLGGRRIIKKKNR